MQTFCIQYNYICMRNNILKYESLFLKRHLKNDRENYMIGDQPCIKRE